MSALDDLRKAADALDAELYAAATERNRKEDVIANLFGNPELREQMVTEVVALNERIAVLSEKSIAAQVAWAYELKRGHDAGRKADWERLGDNAPGGHDWKNDERATRRA